jgi:hypothetical protein
MDIPIFKSDPPPPKADYTRMPYKDLKVGESFIVPEDLRKDSWNIKNRMHYWAKKLGYRFTMKELAPYRYQVWRVR